MNSNICTILEQRKQLAKLRKPTARYEGKYNDNPYENGFTKDQLDMRRKAEILQYKKSASQTAGQMTKKGRYAKLFTVAGNNNICPLDLYLPTLTSSSDVPGPISTLQYNESVPLYNYASGADNYANLNSNTNSAFEVYAENNILVMNGYSVTIASIIINNPTDSTRTFNITVPVGVYISGDVSGNDIYEGIYRNSSVKFGVYYNGILVPGTSSTSTAFSNKYVKIRSTTNHSIFSGALYVGCSTISVELDTQKGFVYELRMSAATELVVPLSGNIFSSETVGVFANMSTGLAPINGTLSLNSGIPVPLINPGKLTIT